jgi:hypothetical protein
MLNRHDDTPIKKAAIMPESQALVIIHGGGQKTFIKSIFVTGHPVIAGLINKPSPQIQQRPANRALIYKKRRVENITALVT